MSFTEHAGILSERTFCMGIALLTDEQAIPHAAHGLDLQRAFHGFQAAAQEMDVVVQIAGLHIAVRAPDFQEQGITGQCLPRGVQEGFQQVALVFGERAGAGRAGQAHVTDGP